MTVGGPKGGAALRPAILYTDTRATQQADKAEAVLGAAYLQEVRPADHWLSKHCVCAGRSLGECAEAWCRGALDGSR